MDACAAIFEKSELNISDCYEDVDTTVNPQTPKSDIQPLAPNSQDTEIVCSASQALAPHTRENDNAQSSIMLGPVGYNDDDWEKVSGEGCLQCKQCKLRIERDWSPDNFYSCSKCRSLYCRLCIPGPGSICNACRLVTVTCVHTLDRLKAELLQNGVMELREKISSLQEGDAADDPDKTARDNIIQQLASILCCPTTLGKHEQELTWRFSAQLMKSCEGPDWFSLLAELHAKSLPLKAPITTEGLRTLWENISDETVKNEMEVFDQDGNSFWLCPGDKLIDKAEFVFHRDSASSVIHWAEEVKLDMRHAMCTLAVLSRAHDWDDKVVEMVTHAVRRALSCTEICSDKMLLAFMTLIMVWIVNAPCLVAKYLEVVLLDRAEKSEEVGSSLFWCLKQLMKSPFVKKKDSNKLDYLQRLQFKFYKRLDADAFERLQGAFTFYSNLKEKWRDAGAEVALSEAFPEIGFRCVPCFEFYAKCVDSDVEVKRFKSKTNPVLFGLTGNIGSDGSRHSQKFILKEDDDVLKEQLVSSILRQLELLWLSDPQVKRMFEKDLALDTSGFSIIPRILEVFEGVALIEVVQNAYTLKELYDEKSEQSIRAVHRFLQNSNVAVPWQKVSHNFGVTSAFWLVLSSLLGLGDRHYGNVMVRKDGSLVHIDYGHILGSDANLKKLLRTTFAGAIRVDLQDITDVVGVDMEIAFWQPLKTTFNTFRSYARLLIEQLRVVEDLFPQNVDVAAFVADRCHPNCREEDANAKFEELLKTCAAGNYVNAIDLAHSHTQKDLIGGAVASAASGLGALMSRTLLGRGEADDKCKICKVKFGVVYSRRQRCQQCAGFVCGNCFATEHHERFSCCVQCAQLELQDGSVHS